MGILTKREVFKPFEYPTCFEYMTNQQKAHWLPTEVPMTDDVYDFNKKLTPSEKNLIIQILRFFTTGDCFCQDTKVLTPKGWKYFRDLNGSDRVAQVAEDNSISFVKPLNYIEKPSSTYKMLQVRSVDGHIDMLVTEGHRIAYEYKGKQCITTASKFLPYQGKKIRRSFSSKGGFSKLSSLERLSIAFQADGHVKKDCDGSKLGYIVHYFYFAKQRKIDRLESILIDGNYAYDKVWDGGYTLFKVKLPNKLCKDLSWVNLEQINTEWAREFLEEVSHWDSHIDKNGLVTYYTRNIKAIEIVLAVASLANIYHSGYRVRKDDRSEKFSDMYTISYRDRLQPLSDGQSIRRGMSWVMYTGKVYCVTVPSGKILVQRNGKTYVSGNCEVMNNYNTSLIKNFPKPEIAMMLTAFANAEVLHTWAYSQLNDTLGLPDSEYEAFRNYAAMRDKFDLMHLNSLEGTPTPRQLAKNLAVFGGFIEGVSLFASFAVLMNFPRRGLMKGVGQIITWSIKDENGHAAGVSYLFRELAKEHKLLTPDFKKEIYDACEEIVRLEDNFIDTCFEMGAVDGLTPEDLKKYIRYIANYRLKNLGLKAIFKGIKENPLDWMDLMMSGKEHANFFEARATEYSKGDTNWGDF